MKNIFSIYYTLHRENIYEYRRQSRSLNPQDGSFRELNPAVIEAKARQPQVYSSCLTFSITIDIIRVNNLTGTNISVRVLVTTF